MRAVIAALALAAQHGRVEVVKLLLDAGEDPSRYNPDGNHSHSTPLHQAVLAGHDAVVRLLVERGGREEPLPDRSRLCFGADSGLALYAISVEKLPTGVRLVSRPGRAFTRV